MSNDESNKLIITPLVIKPENIEKNETGLINYVASTSLFSGNKLSGIDVKNGDAFIGSKKVEYIFNPPEINSNNILLLVKQYKDISTNSEKFIDMKDELDNYTKPRPSRDIIGLENKLVNGDRHDLISDAIDYKDLFAKRLLKYEFSSHISAIHLMLLSKIEEKFNSLIIPMLKDNLDAADIDIAISKMIIEPLADEVSPADPTLTAKKIRGMMFMLTGNCYLKWTKS